MNAFLGAPRGLSLGDTLCKMQFAFFILLAAISNLAQSAPWASLDTLEKRVTCSTPSGSGTCQDTSTCGTFSVAGYCSGSASNQCCVSRTCSTSTGNGICKDRSKGCSGGTFVSGACPGSSDIQCCVSGGGGGGGGSDIPTVDISQEQPDSFYACAVKTYKKFVVRGYQQACDPAGSNVGGSVDKNLAGAIRQAQAAGFTNIEAYLFPCTGSTNGKACKSPATQLAEFENAIAASGLNPVHLWFDIEPTKQPKQPCQGWQLGAAANLQLAQEWVSLLKASKYKYGIYSNGNQWADIFGSKSQSIGATDLPLWAVQDDKKPGVGTTTTFMGGWTSAYAKQYFLDNSLCGGTQNADLSSFSG